MQSDDHLRRLQRHREADPNDPERLLEWYIAQSRIRGSSVYLELLEDLTLWDQCLPSLQQLSVDEVSRQLGQDYKLLDFETFECNGSSHRLASFQHTHTGIELRLIPGGQFTMGSTRFPSNEPIHEASVTPFLLGRFPLTIEQWSVHMPPKKEKQSVPITNVSWHDCKSWLAKARAGFRLPSETEWEYACRAGSSTAFFWGEEMDDEFCWYEGNSDNRPHCVWEHAKKSNSFGLSDVSGNVFEWCEDDWINHYRDGPYDQSPRILPRPTEADLESVVKVYRGMSYCNPPRGVRSASRGNGRANVRSEAVGLRIGRDCPRAHS